MGIGIFFLFFLFLVVLSNILILMKKTQPQTKKISPFQ